MLVLLLVVLFGLGMSYFATQNTGLVHIYVGSYFVQGVPLYLIVIGSLLIGVLISWLISIVNDLSSSITIHGKVSEIKRALARIDKLEQENQSLKFEINRMKTKAEDTSLAEPEPIREANEGSSNQPFLNGFRMRNISLTTK